MAELQTNFVNDLIRDLYGEDNDTAEVAAPKPTGLMANDTATQKAVAEDQEQPQTARSTIQNAIKKLASLDTSDKNEGAPTVSNTSILSMSPNDLYGKHNTSMYKLLSLNKDIDYDQNSLRVIRNTNFPSVYLENLGKTILKPKEPAEKDFFISPEGLKIKKLPKQPAVSVGELAPIKDPPVELPPVSVTDTILSTLYPTEEELMNDNRTDTDALSVVDDGTATDDGDTSGKVDEGLMSRPEAEEQYDKEAMLEINEPKGRGIEVKKYSKMMLDGATEKEKLKGIQGILTKLGYKPGAIDGDLGPGTRRALRKLQGVAGIEVTVGDSINSINDLDVETLKALNNIDIKAYEAPKPKAPVTTFSNEDFKIFSEQVSNIESPQGAYSHYPAGHKRSGQLLYGGYNDHYMGRYQFGTGALKDVGVNTARRHQDMSTAQKEAFLLDEAAQEKAFKDYVNINNRTLTKNSQKYRDMSNSEKLGILGYAHNQGAAAAEEYLVTGVVGTDGFNTKATKYTNAIENAFRKLQPFAAGAR